MPQISMTVDKDSWENKGLVLPPGDYVAEYRKVTPGEGKDSHLPLLKFDMVVEAPAQVVIGGKPVQIGGKAHLFNQCSLSPKASGIMRQLLEAAGVPYTLEGGACSFDYDNFIGKRVVCVVEVETHENREQNRVKRTKKLS